MENQIKQLLLDNATTLLGTEIEPSIIQFQKTRKDVEGDLTLVIFPFVKALKCSPVEAGNKIGDFLLDKLSFVESFNVVSGFLNLIVKSDYWIEELRKIDQEERFGFSSENSKPTR